MNKQQPSKDGKKINSPADPDKKIDHSNTWHLAQSRPEEKLSDCEFLLWRLFYSFMKWQEDCQSCVSNDDVNAQEIALMHLIRMHDRPKSIYEIARLMNRDDMANLQYSLKKLLKLNIIKKSTKVEKRAVFYEITDKGTQMTETYGEIRRTILAKMLSDIKNEDWEKVSSVITEYKNMYDEASRLASLMKKP